MASYDLVIDYGSNFSRSFTLQDSLGKLIDLTTYSASFEFRSKYGNTVLATFSTANGKVVNGGANGILTLVITPEDIVLLTNGFYKLEITDILTGVTPILSGTVFIIQEDKSPVDYLIPQVRLYIGDLNPLAYRYLDNWLSTALVGAIKSLGKWWKNKYLVDINDLVSRNPTIVFSNEAPPIISFDDERVIIIMASIIVLEGSLENLSWSLGSWKDAEISYSNIENGRVKDSRIKRMWDELNSLLLPPTKRLANAKKGSLPGYIGNRWEHKTRY